MEVYPAYAHRSGDGWTIPLIYRVHEERSWLSRVVSRVVESMADLQPVEVERFRDRIHHFVTDSESRESVTFAVVGDPSGETYRLEGPEGEPVRTDLHGFAEGTLTLPADRVEAVRAAGHADGGWLTVSVSSQEHTGTGRVHLVEPEGLSIISDIDDTVKRTGIPGGPRTVVRKTFFEEWEALPDMAEHFARWGVEANDGLAVHFVSAGPWQLQPHLEDFLSSPETGFPEASFHMRPVRKHPLSLVTWRNLYRLIVADDDTYQYKVEATTEIVERFPDREFILVGDTGQDDPEAYRTVRERFPDRIREIVIRDVTDARSRNPDRLEGLTVVPAEDLREGSRSSPDGGSR